MVRITVEMVRKKAEHHDCLLAPLEEISLHQESIEKLEYLQDWCPKLKILLLQNNLIAKIENINKLKSLTYLNLALNNIEVIENLERCESLEKLDLTLNFIGQLTSVENLVNNYNLQNLFLTGNPCTDFDNYRDFVIATLPQLSTLDGVEIDRSERIKALQNLSMIRPDILFEQENYKHQRIKQKTRLEKEIQYKWQNEYQHMDEDERNKEFWSGKCEHAPEVRNEMERMKQLKLKNLEYTKDKKDEKRVIKFFAPDGRPFNINQPKIEFLFNDTDHKHYVLDLSIYKYLDTSLIDIDVQPRYVRVTLKGKIFQLCLPEEINTTESTAQRSQTSGHLVITMPKLNPVLKSKNVNPKTFKYKEISNNEEAKNQLFSDNKQSTREYLEIGPREKEILDFTKMVKSPSDRDLPHRLVIREKQPSADFIDNPEVPDLT